jgi:phthalate 4,5-cis-dihydrodiol dehydrogenase
MPGAELRVGIVGLGAASKLVLPYFDQVEGVRLAAAADLRPEARQAFTARFGLPAFAGVEELCRSNAIDAVWIETPNRFHAEHTIAAAGHGKHVISAKPLATTMDECGRMIAAARTAGVRLLVGHSKLFDAPIRAMGEIVRSGRLGQAIQIDTLLYNDWLRRPRLASELDESAGEGFLLRQAPHLVEIATYIAAAAPVSVRAMTGRWSATSPGAGNAAALMSFDSGAIGHLALNGYGYFDSSELSFGIGTMGDVRPRGQKPRDMTGPLAAEQKYAAPSEADLRRRSDAQPFVGLTIVACERGVIRQSPAGLLVYTEDGCEELSLPPPLGRAAELIELRDALRENRDVFPNGEWGRATVETCLAILRSAREGRDIALTQQAGPALKPPAP